MAILESWSDGYLLTMDPRREDPLFYYRLADDWSGAIGFEVLPLYGEWTAEEVVVSVWREHRPRELALSDTEREQLYVRVVPGLAAHHDAWKRIALKGTNLESILAGDSLASRLEALGFHRAGPSDPGVFRRG